MEMSLNLSHTLINWFGVGERRPAHRRSHLDSIGNWCDHDPDSPKFFQPNSKHKNRPDVIQYARKNLERFYNSPHKWLKSLEITRRSTRQQRTEGREREAAVLGILLHYTELATLRVGVPKENGKFVSLDMKFLAKKLGWRDTNDDKKDIKRINTGKAPLNKGVKRVWRSIRALKAAGYIVVYKRFEKILDGEKDYRGLPAIRFIHPKLFLELGISPQKLRVKREQAEKRLKKRYRNYVETTETATANSNGLLKSLLNHLNSTKQGKNLTRRNVEQSATIEKQRLERICELRQLTDNKNLHYDEFYAKYPELERNRWESRYRIANVS